MHGDGVRRSRRARRRQSQNDREAVHGPARRDRCRSFPCVKTACDDSSHGARKTYTRAAAFRKMSKHCTESMRQRKVTE